MKNVVFTYKEAWILAGAHGAHTTSDAMFQQLGHQTQFQK
jgi:hypothetical protein